MSEIMQFRGVTSTVQETLNKFDGYFQHIIPYLSETDKQFLKDFYELIIKIYQVNLISIKQQIFKNLTNFIVENA